ncbi:Cobalt import ATP-binding protein CbiO [bioreactor metagenome]|uniref:Cobalt import ATP-binding protein CbiO n=1 Tax=bioreactor metagenome TaxID=1076179 RepID=A0A644W5F1_9ZZZZ|nr:ABC transporter ATP-binding protein [Acidaminococcaceae bacterium]NLU43566.1 ABC transporter ATP-binding protein [Acholeplasmataceae bacterium]
MLKIEKLSVRYPDQTIGIDNVSLCAKEGESVALIGANGAGKTSLIMALVGVIPSNGNVFADNVKLNKDNLNEIRNKIGVVFQNPDDQLFMPTIYDNIAFGLRNMGMNELEINARIETCLSLLNIKHLRNKTALKISGGEKRMAALATVLVMEPSIMLFDEPTAFLDPKARRILLSVLNGLQHTKIIATHDLMFAAETCKRSVLLKDGSVFADGPSKELLYDVQLMDKCGVEAIGACGREIY